MVATCKRSKHRNCRSECGPVAGYATMFATAPMMFAAPCRALTEGDGMSPLQTAERARARYADALYQSALLRDPDSARAARAVIAAFRRVDWATVPLDDRTEA